ncbi:MAG TPA: hypothetical protein VHC96_13075 [Puia sp.]|nr:hypothetical protein [Puia sp.]
MLSKWTILAISISLTLGSCQSTSHHNMDLLTSSPWKYEKAGFDTETADEDAASFNALDPRIIGFEKDYAIVFRTDGTGALKENRPRNKHHNADSLPFFWSFQNNDSVLYFQDQYYKIQTLNNDRLVIYADQHLGGDHSRYTIILRH